MREKWFVQFGMAVCGIVCWFREKVSGGTAHDKRDRPALMALYAGYDKSIRPASRGRASHSPIAARACRDH
jgi:hypothetical protein